MNFFKIERHVEKSRLLGDWEIKNTKVFLNINLRRITRKQFDIWIQNICRITN